MNKKIIIIFLAVTIVNIYCQKINFKNSSIIISNEIELKIRNTTEKILKEEIFKRTNLLLNSSDNWDVNSNTIISICLSSSKKNNEKIIPINKDLSLSEFKAESFSLKLTKEKNQYILWILGADNRGILFGIGEFLRRADFNKNEILIDENLEIISSPKFSIRGHQLGYRNTANSYDAWTVTQYEQYIRDLVIFGTNAIENIPFGNNGDESPHFKISRKEMNIELSKICDNYDIDYCVWIPATVDLSIDSLFNAEVEKHEAYYKETPRINDVFIPGGDPGHNHPKYVLPFLKHLYSKLIEYHSKAGIWISLQGFSEEQIDYFYKYLNDEKPKWLKGIVSGPSSPPIAETRFRLPQQYLHRHYPDITHNVRCEYPVQKFDQAYALTIGREGINPRPYYYSKIHAEYANFTDGFVSYSDGSHDDVNKIIWSQRAWNLNKSVRDILIEYCKYFFGNKVAINSAEGILALEKNWHGPLKLNGSVETTYSFWKFLEVQNPQLKTNWRWLMLQLRASYDAYVRKRLIYEKQLEDDANFILSEINNSNINYTMQRALSKIFEGETKPIELKLKWEIENYCDDLYNQIGLQTSVKLYKANNSQRGCILDFVDYPLNNRWWYQDEFKKIENLQTNEEKVKQIEIIRNWENPGNGSYYDDVSNISNSPHVKTTVYDAVDFGWWNDGFSRMRLSSQVYQNEPILEYENLDPNARYLIRVTGFGDALLRIDDVRMEPVLYNKELEQFKEFVVPKILVGDGKIKISFDRPEESHLNWRNYSRISDVWLLKR